VVTDIRYRLLSVRRTVRLPRGSSSWPSKLVSATGRGVDDVGLAAFEDVTPVPMDVVAGDEVEVEEVSDVITGIAT